MNVTFVHVYVKPEFVNDFIDATRLNHEKSIREEGNFRFDILQDAAEPGKFVLYEAYETDQAAAAHKTKAHYFEWRDRVASWMAKPREGVKQNLLFPSSK